MITTTENLVQIKKTKSVAIYADNEGIALYLEKSGEHVWIPKNIAFQILRGLVSYTQKYYRKHEKSKIL